VIDEREEGTRDEGVGTGCFAAVTSDQWPVSR
jgi:hypothetical protein